ncbi:protein kinase domain-containing protein [Undibacterium sp. Di26W]|uniref:protein kinase domain-containing protein n=1 Tax=Undibacterium sp. Di26W TaxID=3413035 RepID=UPI003BEF6384
MQNTNQDSTTLRHYEFKQRLGEGGFGQVHEAWDTKLRRPVAIKQLKHIEGMAQPASLIKEARLAASLKHPAFVKVFAIEEEGDSQSIVMELVPGHTLKQLLQQEKVSEQHAINIISQVAEAMQEAHASGLIHGDLKPSNLMVEPDGRVRILDFGLASQADVQATTSLSQVDPQGTIAYMAPERMMGAAVNVQTDIYALGVILYEIISGTRPFASASGLALAAALMQSNSDTWEFPANTNPALVKLVLAMTAKQTEKRLGSMQQVCEKLRPLVSVMTVKANLNNSKSITSNKGWKQLSTPKRALLLLAALIALAYGTWQAVPYLELDKMSLKPYSESLTLKQGLEALKQFDRPGSLDRATKSFETILKHDGNSAAAVAGLSLVYSFRYTTDGQDEIWLQKADASAQQAVKMNGQLALSYVARGAAATRKDKHEQAFADLDRALVLDPENYFAWLIKATVLRKAHRFDEAIKFAELAIQKFPNNSVFAGEIGTAKYLKGDSEGAEKAFRLSIKMEPDAVLPYANLNAALLRLNRNDEALNVLQQGLQIRPSAALYTNLGNALFIKGDYLAAVEAFQQAVSNEKGNPNNYFGWANLADALLWIPSRKNEAQTAYTKAIQLIQPRLERSPNDATLVSRMGLYSARIGNKEKSLELIKHSLELAPKSADVHFRAGLAYELLEDRTLALDAIHKALELGYPVKLIDAEPDLLALRRDDRYPQK